MQGWTPLHVAVSPKTHIKDLVDWEWTEKVPEEWMKEHTSYTDVSKQMIGRSDQMHQF